MSTTEQPTTEAQTIIDTAKDTVDRAQLVEPGALATGSLAIFQTVHRAADAAETVHTRTHEEALEQPHRQRGTTRLDTVDSFVALSNRLIDTFPAIKPHPAAFLDREHRTITTVLNYENGWGDHRVEYRAGYHPDFEKWLYTDAQWMKQDAFAMLLQDLRHTIIRPDAADIVQIARTFTATRTAHFESGIHLQSGDVQLSYVEETNAKSGGTVEIPEIITLRLAPYRDALELIDIDLEFRFDAGRDGLRLAYRIIRRDEVLEQAWNTIADHATNGLECDTYHGPAPRPIDPIK